MNEVHYPDPGEVPALDWIDKTLIDIDTTYQRGLDGQRVEKIASAFAWDSFGAVVVAPAEGGRFHCIDGQHRLAAAKRHPKISAVPAIVIAKSGLPAEAATFVNVNGARKNVSALEMYWAELAAGNEDAETVKQVSERAGIRIMRYPGSGGTYSARETVAIQALRWIVDKHGAFKSRRMLEVLAKADVAPITANQVRAVEVLMADPEFSEAVDAEALTDSLRAYWHLLDGEADAFAATHRLPKTRALAMVWFKKTRKKRKAA